MFIYYQHGSQLAPASFRYRVETIHWKIQAKTTLVFCALPLVDTQFIAKGRIYSVNFWPETYTTINILLKFV